MSTAWPTVSLGDVCELKYGKSLPKAKRSGEGFGVYGSNGQVGRHQESLTAGTTIVIGRKGSFGEVAYSAEPCWPIDTTYYVDATATDADLRWLYYRLKAMPLTELNRAAAVPGLNRDDAYAQPLLLPPIDEQRRIAAVLDAADALRAQRRQALTKLDTLTRAIFIDMFGSPGTNPNGYPVAQMIELVDPDRPITYGILKPGPDTPAGVPYVRVLDMVDGSIHSEGLRRTTSEISAQYKRSLLRSGDVLLSIRGHVGRLALVADDVAGANITQDTARLSVVGAEPTYVLECLRSVEMQRWMAVFTKGAAVRGINLTDVKKIPVPLPPHKAQQRFAEVADRVQSKRTAHRASAERLDTLFASLQQRAFRGDL